MGWHPLCRACPGDLQRALHWHDVQLPAARVSRSWHRHQPAWHQHRHPIRRFGSGGPLSFWEFEMTKSGAVKSVTLKRTTITTSKGMAADRSSKLSAPDGAARDVNATVGERV